MAAGAEVTGDAAVLEIHSTSAADVDDPCLSPNYTEKESEKITEKNDNVSNNSEGEESGETFADGVNNNKNSDSDLESKLHKFLKELKLNPLAKEFFPSSYHPQVQAQMGAFSFVPFNKMNMGNDDFPNNRRVYSCFLPDCFVELLISAICGFCLLDA